MAIHQNWTLTSRIDIYSQNIPYNITNSKYLLSDSFSTYVHYSFNTQMSTNREYQIMSNSF